MKASARVVPSPPGLTNDIKALICVLPRRWGDQGPREDKRSHHRQESRTLARRRISCRAAWGRAYPWLWSTNRPAAAPPLTLAGLDPVFDNWIADVSIPT